MSDPSPRILIWLPEPLNSRLREYCRSNGLGLGATARAAIVEYLAARTSPATAKEKRK